MSLFDFLHDNIDYIIIGLLSIMSFFMVWAAVERFMFLGKVQIENYENIHDLDIDLTRNITIISTVGSNAPYVGLLGTVVGILLTFYNLGASNAAIDASHIMLHLSLALKATAMGIIVSIPSMILYNAIVRKIEVFKLKWHSMKGN